MANLRDDRDRDDRDSEGSSVTRQPFGDRQRPSRRYDNSTSRSGDRAQGGDRAGERSRTHGSSFGRGASHNASRGDDRSRSNDRPRSNDRRNDNRTSAGGSSGRPGSTYRGSRTAGSANTPNQGRTYSRGHDDTDPRSGSFSRNQGTSRNQGRNHDSRSATPDRSTTRYSADAGRNRADKSRENYSSFHADSRGRGSYRRSDAQSADTRAARTGGGARSYSGAGTRTGRTQTARHDDIRDARPQRDEIAIPRDADPRLLDQSVRAELRTLSKMNAEIVAGHLVAAGRAIDSDPVRALAHAQAARARAARIGAVREAVGVCAYHAGQWAEALSELRTARRISGDPRNLAMIADAERALGKPAQAIRVLSDPDASKLDPESKAELLVVVAGARRDLGQLDAALTVLARGGLDRARPRPGSTRLWYLYADILFELGRTEEAAQWFAASAGLDVTGETDAAERAAALL